MIQNRFIATTEDPSVIRSFRGHQKAVGALSFAGGLTQLASGGSDGVVFVWNFKPESRAFKFVGHKGKVAALCFYNSGKTLVSAGEDQQIRFWQNNVRGKCTQVKGHTCQILGLQVSEDDSLLLSCSADKTVKLWTGDGKFKKTFNGHTNWVRQVDLARDQRVVLSCSDDRTLRLWDLNNCLLVDTYAESRQPVLCCQFSPDGTSICGGTDDGAINLWDVRSKRLVQHYQAHAGAVNSLAFHPYGFHLSSVGEDGLVKVWDLRTGRQGWTLFGHEGAVRAVAFSKEGSNFATAGSDGKVLVWKSNFEESVKEHNRQNQKHFLNKQTENGPAIKPLWKSNRVALGQRTGGKDKQAEEDKSQKEERHPLSQALAPVLDRLVNQLELITTNVVKMDERLLKNETRLQTYLQMPRVMKLMDQVEEGEGREHLAVWEHFREQHPEPKEEVLDRSFKQEEFGSEFSKEVSGVREEERREGRKEEDEDLQQTLKLLVE